MDKSRFEHLVEKRMNKDKEGEKFDLNMIVEMMEQLGGLSPLDEAIEGGRYAQVSPTREKAYKGLPKLDISMFAWADPTTGTGAQTVQRFKKEREKLDNILAEVRGNSRNLESVLKKLEKLLSRTSQINVNNPQDVQRAINSLFAVKMITEIVANFNVSAAGYIFEPFMAALIGPMGRQVETSERILPDIQVGRKYYGLKLIGSTEEVKGSGRDLINFFLVKGQNQTVDYIVAYKTTDSVQFRVIRIDIKVARDYLLDSPKTKAKLSDNEKKALKAAGDNKGKIKAEFSKILKNHGGKIGDFRIKPTDIKSSAPLAEIPLGAELVAEKVETILGSIAQGLAEIQMAVEATQTAVFNYAESGLKEKERKEAEVKAKALETKVETAATL